MYQINGLLKLAEVYEWENGCDPDTARAWDVAIKAIGETTEDVIRGIAEKLGIDLEAEPDSVDRNAGDEPGRVEFFVTEGADGSALSKSDWEKFKAGKFRAWYCTYTGYMEQVSRVSA